MGGDPEDPCRDAAGIADGVALRCSSQDRNGAAVVRVAGEVDWATGTILRRELAPLLTRRSPRVVVDLAEVAFLDSSGLSVLIRAHRQAMARGGWIRLSGPRATIRKILRMAGADRVLHVHDTVEEALSQADRLVCGPAAAPPITLGAAYGLDRWLWPGRPGVDQSSLN